jgi:hypothetical protein
MDKALEREVRSRAGGLCQYCHAQQAYYPERFQIDHIVAIQHGGETASDNLALCCLECNRRKGPNIAAIDPESGRVVPLFHPLNDLWNRHFAWAGARAIGLTAKGRATIRLLEMNRAPRVMVRGALISEGVFPPPGDKSRPSAF